MSSLFFFIATKTTNDFVVPATAFSQAEFNRKVHNAFQGMVGGTLTVGDLKLRPTQDAIANHLLCDGSTITRAQFPQLVELLNPGQNTATLPNYSGAVAATVPTVTQTISDGGTVSTGTTPTDAGTAGGTTGGNIVSGGTPPKIPPTDTGVAT